MNGREEAQAGMRRDAVRRADLAIDPRPTRLARLGRRARLLVAALLLAAMGAGLAAGPGPAGLRSGGPDQGDAALYRAVAARVAAGQDYYPAAAAEQRARHYPLRPFVAMRPPTLAVLTAMAGGAGPMLLMLRVLAGATVAAVAMRLWREGVGGAACIGAVVLLGVTLVALAQPLLAWWHELWAGLLVMLALACRRPRRWRTSLALGLLAVLVRELAFPLLPIMAATAWRERQRPEALAWAATAALALALLAAHAGAVAAVTGPADARSPGWAAAGGLPFVLGLVRRCTLLTLLPWPATAIAVPLALLGWAARPGGLALRASLLLLTWLGAFLLIGRPDNFYWGLLLGPLLTIGVALAPAALADLVRGGNTRPPDLLTSLPVDPGC